MSSWPLLQSIENMDTAEFGAFIAGCIALFLAIGLSAQSAYGRRSMGHYWNGFYAVLGGYLGLCIHERWFHAFQAYEPSLTIFMVAAGLLMALQGATVLASW